MSMKNIRLFSALPLYYITRIDIYKSKFKKYHQFYQYDTARFDDLFEVLIYTYLHTSKINKY